MSATANESVLHVSKILKAPGQGLLTVSSGSGAASKAMAPYFANKSLKNWGTQVAKILSKKHDHLFLVGVPSDGGGGICRGAAHGPLALRETLYKKHAWIAGLDLGDVPVIPQLVHDEMLSSLQHKKSGQALWGPRYKKQSAVSPLNLLEDLLVEVWTKNPKAVPIVLGGDHSVSGGVFAALKKSHKTKNLAVLHFDAHTDLLETRFGVDHCFGTWTSHAVRTLGNPASWVQLGIRASRRPKSFWQKKFGLKQYWAQDLRALDPKKFAAELVKQWRKQGCTGLYVTFDIDGIDASEVPSTGTPESAGLKSAWCRTVMRECMKQVPLVGADLVEVAPVLGSPKDRARTLKVAAQILEDYFYV